VDELQVGQRRRALPGDPGVELGPQRAVRPVVLGPDSGGSPGSLISSGWQDTIRTNGTPAVISAGNPTTLSSTITSGLTLAMISVS
jgi:hypothetical protein